MVDLALYIVIAFQESNANFNTGSPASLVRTVDEQLARTDDGTFSLEEEASLQLASKGAWGLLVGTAIWSQNLPADVPRSYSRTTSR